MTLHAYVSLTFDEHLLTTGLVDPWHAASILSNISSTVTAIVIPDTAHGADMIYERSSDSPALIAARKVRHLRFRATVLM